MKIALNEYESLMSQAADKMAELQDANKEMLEALEEIAAHSIEFDIDEIRYIAKAAIQKARSGQ